jgi:RES domain-containing protein
VIRTGWRLVPALHAASAFDGEGARLYGGRWNSKGAPLVYASEHQSLAVLELRVHIDTTSMRRPYKLIGFTFDDLLLGTLPFDKLPADWRREPPPPSLQRLGDQWVAYAASPILAVPSAIVPAESNLLLNPKHPDFSKLGISTPIDFSFDLRLFH